MKRGMLANHHTPKGWNAHSGDVDAIIQEYMSKKSQLYIAWQSAKVAVYRYVIPQSSSLKQGGIIYCPMSKRIVDSKLVGIKVTVSMGRTERGRENRAG